jgi:hypothetical protein
MKLSSDTKRSFLSKGAKATWSAAAQANQQALPRLKFPGSEVLDRERSCRSQDACPPRAASIEISRISHRKCLDGAPDPLDTRIRLDWIIVQQ